ncbi:MAG: NAD(+)/NADH kinase, partial [Candidatus Thioglobus sp.]|nr:NAD(+)/NADH kinase [Candidatus Thioglobus sp.]
MKTSFKKILFTVNPIDLNSMESLDIILGDLQDMHTNIDLYAINSDANTLSSQLSHKINRLEIDEILNNDLIISIGGDGTMLQSAKLAHKLNIPITGINKGRLGFLTDINPDQAGEVIKNIINGQYAEENRLLIKATVNKQLQDPIVGYGLNDVVIKRKETGRMIRIKILIDQKYINTHEGDGFIVASPTGSTAYALSCG